MNYLPDEVLVEIFSYFPTRVVHETLGEVCTRWNGLRTTPRLNTHIGLHTASDYRFLRGLSFTYQFKSCYLTMTIAPHELDRKLERLGDLCPNLEYLLIGEGLKMRVTSYTILSRCFPRLRYLNMALRYSTYPEEYIATVEYLESLVINDWVEPGLLTRLAERCDNLTELHLHGRAGQYRVSDLNDFLYMKRRKLKKLTLKHVALRTFDYLVSCRKLTELRLYRCDQQCGMHLSKLSALTELKVLHITGMWKVPQANFNAFIRRFNFTRLIDLNLSATPFCDLNADHLRKQELNLRRLELHSCTRLTKNGVVRMAISLRRLIVLDLNMTLTLYLVDRLYTESTVRILRYFYRNYKAPSYFKDKIKLYHAVPTRTPPICREGWSSGRDWHDRRTNYLGRFIEPYPPLRDRFRYVYDDNYDSDNQREAGPY